MEQTRQMNLPPDEGTFRHVLRKVFHHHYFAMENNNFGDPDTLLNQVFNRLFPQTLEQTKESIREVIDKELVTMYEYFKKHGTFA